MTRIDFEEENRKANDGHISPGCSACDYGYITAHCSFCCQVCGLASTKRGRSVIARSGIPYELPETKNGKPDLLHGASDNYFEGDKYGRPIAPRLIVGIDPGLDGALVVLTVHGPAWRGTFVTRDATIAKPTKGRTYDYRLMRRTLDMLTDGPATVVIETPQAYSNAPRGASLSTGFGVGLWLGLVVGLRPEWSILMVAPNIWHRALFGKHAAGEAKARAATFAMAQLPSLDPRCGGRFRKAHQGVLDAACLAMYGLIQPGKPR